MLTKIIAIALLLALAAAGVAAYIAHDRGQRLDVAKAQHETDESTIQGLTSAADDNKATIKSLQARLEVAAGQLADVQAAQAAAQHQITAAMDARDAALAQLRAERSRTYATHQDAATWSRGRMPAVLSDGLRNQWRKAQDRPRHTDH